MNILEKAIQIEGSVNALAMALGVKQNVISNWRARNSVPQGWEKLMEVKYSEYTRHPANVAEKAAA